MSSSKNAADTTSSSTQIIVGTFLDTTWRMFVPVLGFTLLGWMIDKALMTRPIGILSGLAIGVLDSAFLTVRLYQSVAKQMQKEQKK